MSTHPIADLTIGHLGRKITLRTRESTIAGRLEALKAGRDVKSMGGYYDFYKPWLKLRIDGIQCTVGPDEHTTFECEDDQ